MKHAREDYQQIQDPSGKIPENEPVFLLRGQDKYAPVMLRIYANLVALAEGFDQNLVMAVIDQADAMDKWQLAHDAKEPDL